MNIQKITLDRPPEDSSVVKNLKAVGEGPGGRGNPSMGLMVKIQWMKGGRLDETYCALNCGTNLP